MANELVINSSSSGAQIYYTTDGSDPTTSSTLYEPGVELTDSVLIKAVGVKENWIDSDIATYNLILQDFPEFTIRRTTSTTSIDYRTYIFTVTCNNAPQNSPFVSFISSVSKTATLFVSIFLNKKSASLCCNVAT